MEFRFPIQRFALFEELVAKLSGIVHVFKWEELIVAACIIEYLSFVEVTQILYSVCLPAVYIEEALQVVSWTHDAKCGAQD